MSKLEEINIWWEGSFSIDDILDDEIDSSIYDNTSDKIGIYQIYGTHPLYGSNKLLYIGRTTDKNGFKSRLKNRWVIENGQDTENIKIYLGTIFSDIENIKNKENDLIEKAEILLINALKPAFNSSNIQSVGKKLQEQNYIIYNYNNYRDIYPILSSKHFWKDSNLNFVITDKLAKKFKAEIIKDDEYYMFALPKNDNIFIGVDYECWNKTKQPIQLYIEKKFVNNIQIKNIKNKFEILNHQDKDNECYYISLAKNLKYENIINDIINDIIQIISDIEKILK
jgi:hypothetical protein